MKIGSVDLAVRPFVIAEIGANHEGDVGVALAMIAEAARAGADAVKFQTYKADTLVVPTETDRFKHFQRLSLADPVFPQLAAAAREAGVLFLSTPFDLAAVDLLDPLVPAFKVSSGDLTFHPLLERVARTGKPILLSTGMAAPAEIDAALDVVQRAAGLSRDALGERVVLLHCVSSYPTVPEAANLQRIVALREEFDVPVGYSDHTLGIVACLGAAALGACVIEKHFTLQKEGRTFRDHALSADPADLSQLTAGVRSLALMLGSGGSTSTVEDANRVSMRRSLVARVDIKAGSVIQRDQIACLRPGGGLPPSALDAVAGRVALADVPAGHQIPPSAVDLR
jgi:N,N'-diacetyllegionaminate synthase